MPRHAQQERHWVFFAPRHLTKERFGLTMTSSRISVFTGRFGSGKTEIALNYALQLTEQGTRPFLVDLDIVTPYFRTRDRSEELTRRGVRVVTPYAVGQHIHVPAIHPQIRGAVEQTTHPVVIDLGGDKQGARALAQYAPTLKRLGYKMYFCVNPYRPFTDTVRGIQEAIVEIETSSRLCVSALVSNPNLMSETSAQIFEQGHSLVTQVSSDLSLPVAFAVTSESLSQFVDPQSLDVELMVIHRFFLLFDSPNNGGTRGP
jgi:hypothetical protein